MKEKIIEIIKDKISNLPEGHNRENNCLVGLLNEISQLSHTPKRTEPVDAEVIERLLKKYNVFDTTLLESNKARKGLSLKIYKLIYDKDRS
jgi:hypothetical protein